MKGFHIKGAFLAITLVTLMGCDLFKSSSSSSSSKQTTSTSDLQLPEQLEVVTNENN
ncbi:hypothetical protein [Endozoicomonas lisbonensis]